MRFLTHLVVLVIAFSVGALSGHSQESKSQQRSIVTVEEPPPAPAVEYDPKSWKEFSDERGMFSIMLPGAPIEADNPGTAGVVGRKFTLKTSAYYLVAYQDFPATFPRDLEKEASLRNRVFDFARDDTVSQLEAKVLNETAITTDGHPGRFIKLSLPDGGIVREKIYVVGKRIYEVRVITPTELQAPDGGRFDESRATKFLDSFKFANLLLPSNNNPDAWKVYSSTQGRFAILFPGTPATKDHSCDTPFGRCDAQEYVVITSAEYRASYTDFVVELEQDAEKRDEILNGIRDDVLADFKAKVLSETTISLDGHPGRIMKLDSPDGTTVIAKSIAVGKRLYQIIITAPVESKGPDEARFNESRVTKFLDSFKLAKPE